MTVAGSDIATELGNQAADATLTHADTTHPILDDEREDIVDYESALYLAQTVTEKAGSLTDAGGLGGPLALAKTAFQFGSNSFGKTGYNPDVFTLYSQWETLTGSDPQSAARQAIARGEKLFNEKTFAISGIAGFNDALNQPTITGSCSSCHNTPNTGGNSLALRMDIGIADESQRTADLPLYTLRNLTTGAIRKTSDPGRALISGRWKDIGSFKVPSLRGLAAHAPYFHNGSAASISDVVSYHNTRFQIGLTAAQISDLSDFLSAL
jgi:hypothetical protein